MKENGKLEIISQSQDRKTEKHRVIRDILKITSYFYSHLTVTCGDHSRESRRKYRVTDCGYAGKFLRTGSCIHGIIEENKYDTCESSEVTFCENSGRNKAMKIYVVRKKSLYLDNLK